MIRILLLFLSVTLSAYALSNNYKVVFQRFDTQYEARQTFKKHQENPKSIISQYFNDENMVIHFRKSGDKHIIVAEPFNSPEKAEAFLRVVKVKYPDAFVSQGVADDYLYLLGKHKQELSLRSPVPETSYSTLQPSSAPTEKKVIIADNPKSTLKQPTTTLNAPSVSTSLSEPLKTANASNLPYFLFLAALGIIALTVVWSIWRESVLRRYKRDYDVLYKEKEQLQQSMQAKNDFIAMMSHEVRTPINAIMGISHLVLESRLTLAQRSQITKLKDSAVMLLTLVNDILNHSKIEAGKVIIEHVPFDLNTLLDDITNIVSHKAEEKGIELIFDIDQSVPHKLIGDPLRLLQVLVNLLNNAIKFTNSGSVTLRARGQQITRVNLKINFEIIDTGIGIEVEELKNLFKPYTQADETIARKYGGSGLGLSICKNLVSLMGGNIRVNSVAGEGSTFSFDVKLHSDFEFEKRRYRLPTTELMHKHALILDTNPTNAAVLQRGLEYFHYDIKIISTPDDFLSLLNRYPIDIVFIDSTIILNAAIKKELQHRIKNDTLKLIWLGEDIKRERQFVLSKPFTQMAIYKILLSAFGYATEDEKQVENTKKLKESLSKFAGETLLLAEDNEINRSIIFGLLAGTSINIITANTGKEAVDIVEVNSDIRVILMDIQMPIMDGYEAAQLIRKEPEKDFIPIIAITGNTLETEIERISQARMDGHIAKPLDINTFYTTLYHAFEKSRNQSKKPMNNEVTQPRLDTLSV